MLKRNDCRLRPLGGQDLELVLSWRNSDQIRAVMYSNHIITYEEHVAWFNRVSADQTSSRHLVFEHQGRPLGQINITDIDQRNSRCRWGFFIGETQAPRGSGMAMGFLGLEYIFETMDMHKLCSEAFAFNIASVTYHEKLGFMQEGCFKEHIFRDGKYVDIICFAYFRSSWEYNKDSLALRCFGGE